MMFDAFPRKQGVKAGGAIVTHYALGCAQFGSFSRLAKQHKLL